MANDSQIWAKKDYPFESILFRNVDIDSAFECINADVTVRNSNFKAKKLSRKVLDERMNNIENEKKLLY